MISIVKQSIRADPHFLKSLMKVGDQVHQTSVNWLAIAMASYNQAAFNDFKERNEINLINSQHFNHSEPLQSPWAAQIKKPKNRRSCLVAA